ncbi:unnamed protein product [Strongylus vulgaris]|uniref:Uncharacterized protein n=1 Tax=Strongylus vulgaris TaxID=40348 RepID=A0A3P7IXH5_STRVU|nr:unnamed protein product [Strongylus vulgaris]
MKEHRRWAWESPDCNSCGDRPHSHQPKMVLTEHLIGTILQQCQIIVSIERKWIQPKAWKEVLSVGGKRK